MKEGPVSVWEPEGTTGAASNSVDPDFATVKRGYDPGQVSEHLKSMAGRTRVLENRVSELESELERARGHEQPNPPAEATEDPYEAMSGRMAEVVRALDQDVERMRQEAEAEAQRIVDDAKAEAAVISRDAEKLRKKSGADADEMLAEATAEADRIRVDAQATAEDLRAEADRALEDAKEKADAALAELTARRTALAAEIRTLHDRMIDSASTLEPILDAADDEAVVIEESAGTSDESSGAEVVSPGR
jgi:cell division septum initiation protein DivIVA